MFPRPHPPKPNLLEGLIPKAVGPNPAEPNPEAPKLPNPLGPKPEGLIPAAPKPVEPTPARPKPVEAAVPAGVIEAPGAILASLTIAVSPSPQAWLTAPAPALGNAPSIPVVPTNGSSPATDRAPSKTFSDFTEMPVGAIAEELVTGKEPPLVAVNSIAGAKPPLEARLLPAKPRVEPAMPGAIPGPALP